MRNTRALFTPGSSLRLTIWPTAPTPLKNTIQFKCAWIKKAWNHSRAENWAWSPSPPRTIRFSRFNPHVFLGSFMPTVWCNASIILNRVYQSKHSPNTSTNLLELEDRFYTYTQKTGTAIIITISLGITSKKEKVFRIDNDCTHTVNLQR